MLILELVRSPIDLAHITIERHEFRALQQLSQPHTSAKHPSQHQHKSKKIRTSRAESTLPSAFNPIASLTFNNFSTASLLVPLPLFILT